MGHGRRAFTLLELILCTLAAVCLILIMVPVMCGQRPGRSFNVVAQANLRSLNTVTANYAGDHDSAIFALSRMHESDDGAAGPGAQARDILAAMTGRSDLEPGIVDLPEKLLLQRYNHLVLLNYVTDVLPEPIAASPRDRNLNVWQEGVCKNQGAVPGLPYADGMPDRAGYDTDPVWTDPAAMALWPYGSTYQMVPSAWLDDDDPVYTPSPNSTMRLVSDPASSGRVGERKITEVAFPSSKVFMYEEFDRFHNREGLYALDPDATVNFAFFDGSVRAERVSEARSAYDGSDPDSVWRAPYVPLDTFPEPKGGLGDPALLDLRFLWSKGGLVGQDF